MQIRIAWLYHDILNIYGDRGNILSFIYRCEQRKIQVSLDKISINDNLLYGKYDFIFGGGGQDKQQVMAAKDLQKKKPVLSKYADDGVPMLLICGTYQLFGHYFLTFNKEKILGISIFNTYTVASKVRKIGNVVIKFNKEFTVLNSKTLIISRSDQLVGFENHSGNTFFTKKNEFIKYRGVIKKPPPRWITQDTSVTTRTKQQTKPLGKVIKGSGNNGIDKTEGAVYKNVIGTYLHGSVLPKNPHLCDWLIIKALERRYETNISLKNLDDTLEWQTHKTCQKLAK